MKKFLVEVYNGDVIVVEAIDKLDAYNKIEATGKTLEYDGIVCLSE